MDILYIIIPAYNEAGNLASVLREWHAQAAAAGPESRLVLLDDGSTDDTPDIARELARELGQLRVIRKTNSGHGPTCLRGYSLALEKGADFVFQTDCDGQTNPEEFPAFWRARHEADFILGRRTGRDDGLARKIVTRVLRALLLLIFQKDAKDANVPFRLMNSRRLQYFTPLIPEDFFLSNVLLTMLALRAKERIRWIPVSFRAREQGAGSLNLPKIVRVGMLACLTLLGFRFKRLHIPRD